MITTTQYHDLARQGVLTPDDRVELIHGKIVRMSPIGIRHAACVDDISWALSRSLDSVANRSRKRVRIRVQGPVRLDDYSEPEPDITVLRPRNDGYRKQSAGPGDVLLLVAVSDTSRAHDRDIKLPTYAAAGIPEVWLVDVAARRVDIYSEPSGDGYLRCRSVYDGDIIRPELLPGVEVSTSDFI